MPCALLLDSVQFHLVSLGPFAGQDIFSLQITVYHDDSRGDAINVTDDDRHGLQSCKLTSVLTPMTGDQLVASILTRSGYGRNKNTILLDAFNGLLHGVIIPHGKRMIRERMKLGKLYAFNHFGCVVRFHTTSLFRFHIWNRRGRTSAASPICKWCTLFVLNAPCAWEINKRLVAAKLIGISPLPGSPPAP